MSKFSERLKELRISKNYTQLDVANLLHVNKQTISQYERGIRQPQIEALEELADIFNVDMNYLLGNENLITRLINNKEYKILEDYRLKEYSEKISSTKGTSDLVPVYNKITASFGHEPEDNIIGYIDVDEQMKTKGELYAVKVSGNSMTPTILDGDIVVVQKDAEIESGDVVVVSYNDNEATCKRVKFYNDGLSLIPDNAAIPPMYFNREELSDSNFKIMGKVVEMRRKI